jgi:DNA-binding MarR family transcriptional regulator
MHTSEDLAAEYSGYLTYRISQLSAKLNAQANRVLKAEFGLSVVKWRILVLVHNAAPVNAAVLCKGLSMDAGLFSRTLKTLVEEKLVKISGSKTDKRQTLISLTKAGKQKVQQAAPVMAKRREQLTDGFSARERIELMRMLNILDRNAAKTI